MNMNESSINEQYQSIVRLLDGKRLKEAQVQLEVLLNESGDYSLHTRLEQAKTSYHYMLQYLQQGVKDSERISLYRRLLTETREMAEQTRLCLLDKVSGRYYHSLRRSRHNKPYTPLRWLRQLEEAADDITVCSLMPDDKTGLRQVLQRHEEVNRDFFLATWANSSWSKSEAYEMEGFLDSESLSVTDRCLAVSAVTLSLQECFDPLKTAWLIKACRAKEVHTSQRAIVGLLLTLNSHRQRITSYSELRAQLHLLYDEPGIARSLTEAAIHIRRSQETEKIDRKMREEIIPEVIKDTELMRSMRLNSEENVEDNDINPDWQMHLSEKLDDKMREMGKLQMEGADIHMSTFSMMKHFPFFQEAYHWFYPFDPMQSQLAELPGFSTTRQSNVFEILMLSGNLCNSDKYSLCFLMNNISAQQSHAMIQQVINRNLKDISEEGLLDDLRTQTEQPEKVSNQYVHDLYRFYKIGPRHQEYHDPFLDNWDFYDWSELPIFDQDPTLLTVVSDFLFQKENYAEAEATYRRLIRLQADNADIYQKSGFCRQKQHDYTGAITAYRKADILKPDNLWTLRHLATCYRITCRYDEALGCYRKLQAMQPDNSRVVFYMANCLMEHGEPEEALQCYFQLDYMEENSLKAWRGIGWCSFELGKNEQAQRYFDKALGSPNPKAVDYLNAGHVAWVMGRLEQTAHYYSQAFRLCGSSDQFRQLFYADMETLLAKGIDRDTIPLVLDLIE